MIDVHVLEGAVPWQLSPDVPGLRRRLLLDRERGRSRVFTFEIAELEPGAELPLAATAQAEVDFILEGRARFRIGGNQVELGSRACAYVPPGMPRSVRALGPGPLRFSQAFGCEALGHGIARTPIDPGSPEARRPAEKTWMTWEETADWAPVEAVKGLRIRFKRVMDRNRPVELIAGIGDIDPGTHYTRHFHDQPEIYHILGGEGIVWVGDEEIPVGPGSTLYIEGRVVHGADSLGAEPIRIYYVYGCERAGNSVNWTPVEEIYAEVRRGGAARP